MQWQIKPKKDMMTNLFINMAANEKIKFIWATNFTRKIENSI